MQIKTESNLVFFPNPILKQIAKKATVFGDDLKSLTEDMIKIMQKHNGIGLAAPQVGKSIRMFVCAELNKNDPIVFINPKLSNLSGMESADEGCLSLPGIRVLVNRYTSAKITAFDVSGKEFEMNGNGLLARIWQHEIDHLDGKLITDGIPGW